MISKSTGRPYHDDPVDFACCGHCVAHEMWGCHRSSTFVRFRVATFAVELRQQLPCFVDACEFDRDIRAAQHRQPMEDLLVTNDVPNARCAQERMNQGNQASI